MYVPPSSLSTLLIHLSALLHLGEKWEMFNFKKHPSNFRVVVLLLSSLVGNS